MSYLRKQGNSLWVNITCDTIPTIDNVWTHWEGVWNIAATLGSTPLLTGSLVRSSTTGVFQLRIGPVSVAGWATLPAGNYILTIQIDNAAVDYRIEESYGLTIKPQGLTP